MPAAHPESASQRVRDELRSLLRADDRVRLSVYLPVQPPPDVAQNEVMRRHAVADATKRLEACGVTGPLAAKRAARLGAALAELEGLAPARGTLAAFDSDGDVRVFPLAMRLPYAVAARPVFVLRPLLRALQVEGPYRVLAVSAKQVALFEGDARGLERAPQGDLPASLEDALGPETTEKQLRMRGTQAGGGAPVFYAHDVANEERKIDLRRFHHAVAAAVNARLEGDGAPLVVAADATHQAGLRAELRATGLLDPPVVASPDHWSASELHDHAWPLVAMARASGDGSAAAAFERARNVGKAVDLLDDVAAAAAAGRVRRLWIDPDRAVPGRVDATAGRALPGEGDSDVMDELAELVLRHGGEVRVVGADALPSSTGVAAELR